MKAKSTPPKKAEPGIISLILAAIFLTMIGLALEDAREVPYESFGGLVWFAALIVSFMFSLFFYAQYVLPMGGNEGWSEGLRLLWRYYSTQGQVYLNNMFSPRSQSPKKSRKKQKDTAEPSVAGLPPGFTQLRAGNLNSHEVLALAKGNSFIRSAGPGFVMLYQKELVTHLIDLRTQLRSEPVKATTRDGIPIETKVTTIFRVRREEEEPPGLEPYPFDKEAIFHISYSQSIAEKDAVRKWTAQIAPRAATMLVNEIARYTLDDLDHHGNGGVTPLDEIKAGIKQQLQRQLESNGIEILGIGVGALSLPEEIAKQRIRNWRAEWERKITYQQAASDAETIRRMKRARARAQIEILENITQNIANVREMGDADLSQIITLRMIEALEVAESSPALQAIIPRQLMATLVQDSTTQMRAWLNPPQEGVS